MNKRKYGNRSHVLHTRVTEETYLEMMKRSDLKGRTLSDYCNRLFERHCKPRKVAQKDYEVVNPTYKKIKEARLAAGLTQRQLADKTGFKQPFIARLEKPEGYPTVRTLQRIAKALELKSHKELIT